MYVCLYVYYDECRKTQVRIDFQKNREYFRNAVRQHHKECDFDMSGFVWLIVESRPGLKFVVRYEVCRPICMTAPLFWMQFLRKWLFFARTLQLIAMQNFLIPKPNTKAYIVSICDVLCRPKRRTEQKVLGIDQKNTQEWILVRRVTRRGHKFWLLMCGFSWSMYTSKWVQSSHYKLCVVDRSAGRTEEVWCPMSVDGPEIDFAVVSGNFERFTSLIFHNGWTAC